MEPSSAGQGKWRRQSERRTPNCRSDNPAQRCPSRDDGRDEFALDCCVDRSPAISTRVRLFRLFLLIPCWESQRLIPKRSAGPRATKIGVVSLKALDHHRPNREESFIRIRLQSSSTTHPSCKVRAVGSIASGFIPPNPFAVSPNEEERSALDVHAPPGLEKRDTVQSMSRERPAALGSYRPSCRNLPSASLAVSRAITFAFLA